MILEFSAEANGGGSVPPDSVIYKQTNQTNKTSQRVHHLSQCIYLLLNTHVQAKPKAMTIHDPSKTWPTPRAYDGKPLQRGCALAKRFFGDRLPRPSHCHPGWSFCVRIDLSTLKVCFEPLHFHTHTQHLPAGPAGQAGRSIAHQYGYPEPTV